MRKISWLKWAAAIAGGALLLQTTTCTDAQRFLVTTASIVTASGVVYLVWRVAD